MKRNERFEQTGQEFFLTMNFLRKGNYKTDAEGNFYFDVEASNENLDLEQQRVLQRALMDSKDYFLSNGVISKDHLHKQFDGRGQQVTDEDYVIGEPIDVYTDGKSTRVKGKLYQKNPHAQKFIQLLESGSTRVKASVGGILPKVVNMTDGTGKVVSVLWNDLALTIAPVNYTVAPASGIAKSLSSLEFVKSLSAGYGSNTADFTGGRALIPEDVENQRYEEAVAGLIGSLMEGGITDIDGAKAFLEGYGFSDAAALDIIGETASEHTAFEEVLYGKTME
jgi:hypothetical protein